MRFASSVGGFVARPTVRLASSLASTVVRQSPILVDGGAKALVAGEWVGAARTFPVLDPASGETVADCPELGRAETERAIAAAQHALDGWRRTPTRQRAKALYKWHAAILAHADNLATLMTLECGKPKAEAFGEVTYAASFVEWYAEEAPRIEGHFNAGVGPERRLVTTREPIGVSALITPWNFPAAMVTRKMAPALAAGCSVVIKPSEDTPLTALALCRLAEPFFPSGVINVVPCSRANVAAVGDALCESPVVRALSFTGSTAVGKRLYAASAGTVKKLSLELGGNAPFIVLADADVDVAVNATLAAKFRNAGQTCVCPDRFLVHESVFDAYLAALTSHVAALKIGHGLEAGVTLGPLVNPQAANRVDALVRAAEPHATCHAGGSAAAEAAQMAHGPSFYPATVLEVQDATVGCWASETFGPVVAVRRFTDLDEAIALANEGQAGLASYVVSRDHMRAMAVADRLEYGMVAINSGVLGGVAHCFGGTKESGLGREGAKHGLEEFLSDKAIVLGGLDY